jgi:hypothetical protein
MICAILAGVTEAFRFDLIEAVQEAWLSECQAPLLPRRVRLGLIET